METSLISGEEEVLIFIGQPHRVGRRTERTVRTHIVIVRLVIVTDVHRVAIRARAIGGCVVPPCRLRCAPLRYGFAVVVNERDINVNVRKLQRHINNLFTGIIHIQTQIGFASLYGVAAVAACSAMHRACKKHNRRALQRLTVLVAHDASHRTGLGHGNEIIAYLTFNNLYGIAGSGACRL